MKSAIFAGLFLAGAVGCVARDVPVAVAATAPLLHNATCPVSGEPVAGSADSPTFTAVHDGVTVGFMCPAHLAEFEAGTVAQKDAWVAKARLEVAAQAAPHKLPQQTSTTQK